MTQLVSTNDYLLKTYGKLLSHRILNKININVSIIFYWFENLIRKYFTRFIFSILYDKKSQIAICHYLLE